MNILVTGGLGSVGRPLVKLLVKNGHAVKVIGRRPEAEVEAELIPGASYTSCDINEFSSIRQQVRGMDTVIHLAAIPAPMMAPGVEIFRINCSGTFNVYEAAAQEGIRRVVTASSINWLGFNFGIKSFPIQYFPLDEAHPNFTTDAYSFSKQIIEEVAAYYWRREGISGKGGRHLPGECPERGCGHACRAQGRRHGALAPRDQPKQRIWQAPDERGSAIAGET